MKTITTLLTTTILFLNITIVKAIDQDKTGKQLTKLLRSIKNWDESTYEKYMATPDDILEIILNSDQEDLKKVATQRIDESRKSWSTQLDKEFKRICKKGEELEIDWKKIRYKDFTCELDDVKLKDIYKGKLFFSFNNKTYKISVDFLINNKGVRIGELEHLKEYEE